MVSGSGQVVVDGVTRGVSAGDVIDLPVGWKHTVIASELRSGIKYSPMVKSLLFLTYEDGLWIIEVKMGKEISVADKKKYELSYQLDKEK